MEKKLIRCIVYILTFALLCSAGCTPEEGKNEKLKYYSLTDYGDIIKHYNNYCLKHYDRSYQIEVVEFENEKQLYEKMSTELMAGGGPDIVTLSQRLPFEKLIENNVFSDINELARKDSSKDRVDFDACFKAVMDAGVFNGKRYIVPAFFAPDVIISTKQRLEEFGIDLEQGEAITYKNAGKTFNSYFKNPRDYSFMFQDGGLGVSAEGAEGTDWMSDANEAFCRFILSYVDFKEKKTYFDTPGFRQELDVLDKITEHSGNKYFFTLFPEEGETNKVLFFDPTKFGYSVSDAARIYSNALKATRETPVMLRGFVKDRSTYSAHIEYGVAINNASTQKDKAYCFIKYLLSNDAQAYWTGDKESSNYAGSFCLPVTKSAYAHSLEKARREENDYFESVLINGELSDYAKEYVEIIENVNQCSLYYYTADCYYISSVVGDIVSDYQRGMIDKNKFIQRLTAATKIYLNE